MKALEKKDGHKEGWNEERTGNREKKDGEARAPPGLC